MSIHILTFTEDLHKLKFALAIENIQDSNAEPLTQPIAKKKPILKHYCQISKLLKNWPIKSTRQISPLLFGNGSGCVSK